jgi:predicted RNase H-like HicB family nuclease
MKFDVILFTDADGCVTAQCPAIPGCVSKGRDREEAVARITEAIELSLESRRELGMLLPSESDMRPVELIQLELS